MRLVLLLFPGVCTNKTKIVVRNSFYAICVFFANGSLQSENQQKLFMKMHLSY